MLNQTLQQLTQLARAVVRRHDDRELDARREGARRRRLRNVEAPPPSCDRIGGSQRLRGDGTQHLLRFGADHEHRFDRTTQASRVDGREPRFLEQHVERGARGEP